MRQRGTVAVVDHSLKQADLMHRRAALIQVVSSSVRCLGEGGLVAVSARQVPMWEIEHRVRIGVAPIDAVVEVVPAAAG
jgi:hypothetical protein